MTKMPQMKIPLVDLKATLPPIRDRLFEEFGAILDGMNLFLGANVQAFEREFADYCGSVHGIGVSSGTDALQAALLACGVGPGDEVVAPALTFFATIEAILHTGATPVLVDVEPGTLTMGPEAFAGVLTPDTKAIVPVHLYGHPADMDALHALARPRKIFVIEDCAQAHGARYKGARAGSLGDLGCFSFYFTKNLGAYGEGGFVTTGSAALAERVRLLRHHGHESKFSHARAGFNWRLDELQAAVVRLKLPALDAGNARRREIAARYAEGLAGTGVRLLEPRGDSEPVYHLYPLRLARRDALRDYLEARGVGTGIHYPIPAHRQPALAGIPHRAGPMQVTDESCGALLSIPMYPELRDEQVDYVIDAIREFLRNG